jgi:hypothetical protein
MYTLKHMYYNYYNRNENNVVLSIQLVKMYYVVSPVNIIITAMLVAAKDI